MFKLSLNDTIEDNLLSLGSQYHIIRPIDKHRGLFIDYALDRSRSNLAMARRKVLEAESKAQI